MDKLIFFQNIHNFCVTHQIKQYNKKGKNEKNIFQCLKDMQPSKILLYCSFFISDAFFPTFLGKISNENATAFTV